MRMEYEIPDTCLQSFICALDLCALYSGLEEKGQSTALMAKGVCMVRQLFEVQKHMLVLYRCCTRTQFFIMPECVHTHLHSIT
jgi:hypothetical protein